MAETQLQRAAGSPSQPLPVPSRKNKDAVSASAPPPLSRLNASATTPVSQNGCFEDDKVIKSGVVQKRTQKRKNWKTVFLVLRPNTLSIYRNAKEDKLRHQVYLSDLTAVAFLKDPKHKRKNVFGLFSSPRNFHFEAGSAEEAKEWVSLIRGRTRIDEEEEEMFLASPTMPLHSPGFGDAMMGRSLDDRAMLSSSPEPLGHFPPTFVAPSGRRKSSYMESSGLSGNELASHSDFSDNDVQRLHGASIESLAVQDPGAARAGFATSDPRLIMHNRTVSQLSITQGDAQDPDRVIWQGWLYYLRTKGGVRQWKDWWGVLRPRNLILYKDGSEYTAQRIIRLSAIVNVVDIDPLSKSKTNCLQIITEEKSYRLCARDEESLIQCLGAFKSLLAKRRELEARAAVPPLLPPPS